MLTVKQIDAAKPKEEYYRLQTRAACICSCLRPAKRSGDSGIVTQEKRRLWSSAPNLPRNTGYTPFQ
ncbi:hypothetical protein GCM10009414_21220 [Tatumella terrea]